MSHELSLSISSLVPWMPFELDPSVNFSDQTTSSSARVVLVSRNRITERANCNKLQETTGPRVTTRKVLSLLIRCSMLCDVKLRAATAFKVSRLPTPSVVVLVPVWVRF